MRWILKPTPRIFRPTPDLITFVTHMKKWLIISFIALFLFQCSEFNSKSDKEEQLRKSKKLSAPFVKYKPDTVSPNSSEKQNEKHLVQPIHKKAKKKEKKIASSDETLMKRSSDSLVVQKMLWLRSQNIEIDLNEPKSRDFLFSPVENAEFSSMITLSQERLLQINSENDILDNTDRFYTNGIRFDFISPVFQGSPFNFLMVPYWRSGMNYYGISLVQNMYTPSTTKLGGILYGDRPYAAYLLLKSFKITNDVKNRLRQTSELDIGIIGPASLGDFVQKSFHTNVPTNTEPLGWEYQIQNDLVLNYNLNYEIGIVTGKNFDVNLKGQGCLGTLYTNIGGGILVRTGVFNPYFVNLGISKRSVCDEKRLKRMQLLFSLTSDVKFVGYDATLEGGMFNRTNSYTLSPDEVTRFVYEASGGITFTYGGIGIYAEQYILSPEFHNGWWHKWVHIGLVFCL
jgi:lipid A 3-O-deacylase